VVRQPETHYAQGPEGNIAYQVVGDGPMDLVVVPGWFSHVDMMWADPGWARFNDELASFARVVFYDKLGTGLSDPIVELPTIESRADELRAVVDAVGSERPALFGVSAGGPTSVMFAATYPERVSALAMYGSFVNGSLDPDGTPARATWIELMNRVRTTVDHWGEGTTIDWAAPSISPNARYRDAVGAFERAAMSPKMALLSWQTHLRLIDVRDVLSSVHVPTLVLHRKDEAIPVEFAREFARGIAGARLVELDGVDHLFNVGDITSITGEVEEFLTGQRHEPPADRVLATVLFTDIVDSTRRAVELGDRRWRELLEQHDLITCAEVARFRGRVVKNTGDGFLATFDGPTRAVRCAATLAERLPQLGIEVRSGLHTGECELRGDDIGGVAVHIGARVAALAAAGEVLVSNTVKDLVNGSGITFRDRGTHALKGLPGEWQLFSPSGQQEDPVESLLAASRDI
jgi:class 3 adenylate cyclase